jgi:RNA polymerase sigma-70 factor (ECF subfamily)
VRVATIRIALNLKREAARQTEREHAWGAQEFLAPTRDPELNLLRDRCGTYVRDALEAALAALDRDARNVLRMHYLDGLPSDDIAVAYGVHRATAARWIQQARSAIVSETRRRLRERLQLPPSQLDSILLLVQSAMDVSLRRLLG